MTARFCKSITTASATHGMILAMKTILNCRILLPVVIAVLLAAPARAADPITDQLQQGFLEEEVNRDLEAAVRAYEAAVSRFDDQRRPAATAVFRLGECYRKLGRTEDAIAQYRRIQTEFSDQSTLADLSRTNLARLGVQPDAAPSVATDVSDEEAQEIARLGRLLEDSPDLLRARRGVNSALYEAASNGQLAVVRFLLDSGIDPNDRSAEWVLTALHHAVNYAGPELVELLLDHGAELNPVNHEGHTPLDIAVERNWDYMIQLLRDRGAVSSSAE
jgi:tetratricopeptide (TPR) repeat protein